jgi:hypothetical protein
VVAKKPGFVSSRQLGRSTREHALHWVRTRVRLTVGNRPVYRGNRPYRPGPVTVPAGYQPLGLGFFEFEFQKMKIVEKIPKAVFGCRH